MAASLDDAELPARVDALLAAAGLTGDATTRAELTAMYRALAPGVEAMHALGAARHEAPAVAFDPTPPPARW